MKKIHLSLVYYEENPSSLLVYNLEKILFLSDCGRLYGQSLFAVEFQIMFDHIFETDTDICLKCYIRRSLNS